MRALPDWLRAGAMTGIFVFVTGVSATLIGWVNDVNAWATSSGTVPFPDPSVLRGAAVSAGVAAGSALVNAVVRYVQERLGVGSTPTYMPAASPAKVH